MDGTWIYIIVVFCRILKKIIFPFLYITVCLSVKHPAFLMPVISLLFGCFVFPPRCYRIFQSVTAIYYTVWVLLPATSAGQRGGPVGQLPRLLRRHWSNRKYGAGTHRFSTHARTFPKNYLQLAHAPPKFLVSLVLCRGISKNVGLNGDKLLACLGRPRVCGRLCLRYWSVGILL